MQTATYSTGFREDVARQNGRPFALGTWLIRVAFLPLAYACRAVRSYVRFAKWASEPKAKQKRAPSVPGVALEFLLISLLLVCGLMSALV